MNKIIFVVSGPSGVGKDSAIEDMRKRGILNVLHLLEPKSYTTRPMRHENPYESNYVFVDEQEFSDKVKEGDILESTTSHGYDYGTSKSAFAKVFESGNNILKVLDKNGAAKIKKMYPENAVLIFIVPPSLKELERRLRKRDSETPESFARRMSDSKMELEDLSGYDYIVEADGIQKTSHSIEDILRFETAKRNYCPKRI